MTQFLNNQQLQSLIQWLVPVSAATFFLSLLIIPLIVSNLSATCFINMNTRKAKTKVSLGTAVLLLISNICGLLLLLAGIAMLFLPGQGLLTILIGLLLISFPGKQKLIDHLVQRQSIRQSFDWIRKKSGKLPFVWPKKAGEQ